MKTIFISSSREKPELVAELEDELRSESMDVLTNTAIEYASQIKQLTKTLAVCDAFIFPTTLVSLNSQSNEDVLRRTILRECFEFDKPVFLLADDSELEAIYERVTSYLKQQSIWEDLQPSVSHNLLVVGTTGAGKSTLINALLSGMPAQELKKFPSTLSTLQETDNYERLEFTHFYPAEVPTSTEAPLHVYVHLASALEQVRADFEKRKNFESTTMSATEGAETVFKRGTVFKIVPTIKNARIIPTSMDIEWLDDFEHAQFTVKPNQEVAIGTGCLGHVRIFVAGIIIAELPFLFNVCAEKQVDTLSQTSFPYKKIFISYAHEDQQIVKLVERFYSKNPDLKTMVDYKVFREGDDWWEKAKESIRGAEAVQLFWSQHAADSEPVQREWRYALDLPRHIIPIMMKPEAPIPEPLSHLYFGDFDQFIDNL